MIITAPSHLQAGAKKETILDLQKYINQAVRVKLQGGRECVS